MKSDTRYSHFVNDKTKSGKTMDSGGHLLPATLCRVVQPVSTVVPAVYEH
ncbi:hypothetical protein GCM10010912_01950 [Paenibacillus albidus]|uniref:Uncharacterized protein n=1 Tax=Paenibacillus albidus TaxID=2041023 RepID=A0A917BYD9_9BACL|nr:hypothetical protein GCM10010912_01950 [Paenibacillus albidus]